MQKTVLGALLAGGAVLPARAALEEVWYGQAYGPGQAPAPGGAYARGAGRISKAAAHYQYHPRMGQHCAVCVHFRPPGSCEIVRGRIYPNGWCRYFMAAGGPPGGPGGYGPPGGAPGAPGGPAPQGY